MVINELDDKFLFENYLQPDENGREINIYKLDNSQIVGDLFYPNCLICSSDKVINPINEKTMSLKNLNSNKEFELDRNIIVDEVNDPVFFFIYNTDN